ncbi:hypothetical protein SAMN05216239_1426 [Bacillus amyloliquefaciens]|nr:hypothetical protein SAMN05216239_1426 [Bacillus amyloliquefaciens]
MAARMIKNSSSLMVKLSIHQTPAPVSAPASPFLNRLPCWKSCSKYVRIKYNKYKISNTASQGRVKAERDGFDDFEHAAEYDDLA